MFLPTNKIAPVIYNAGIISPIESILHILIKLDLKKASGSMTTFHLYVHCILITVKEVEFHVGRLCYSRRTFSLERLIKITIFFHLKAIAPVFPHSFYSLLVVSLSDVGT